MSYIVRDTIVTIPLATITALAGVAVIALRAPFAGTVEEISGTVNAAFITSDIVITGRINTNAITTGAVTIPTAGSGFGTTVAAVPTAAKTFAAGDILNFTITGGVGVVNGAVTMTLRRSN